MPGKTGARPTMPPMSRMMGNSKDRSDSANNVPLRHLFAEDRLPALPPGKQAISVPKSTVKGAPGV